MGELSRHAVLHCTLLHVSREFYFVKFACRNLYASFSHVRKAYTANYNDVQLLHTWKYN